MKSTQITQPKNKEKSKKHTKQTFGLLKEKGSFEIKEEFAMTDEELIGLNILKS